MLRKVAVVASIGLLAGATWWTIGKQSSTQSAQVSQAQSKLITVYKSPTCGCCTKWEAYLEQHGFSVESRIVSDVSRVKAEKGIPHDLASCHTAEVNGYLIEGHVPVEAINRLLAQKPSVKGISVPGMPIGSPGMEGAYVENYDVMAFDGNGGSQVFQSF